MKMENVAEVVKAFLAMVDCKEISELDEKKLYKIIMMAHSQGLGRGHGGPGLPWSDVQKKLHNQELGKK